MQLDFARNIQNKLQIRCNHPPSCGSLWITTTATGSQMQQTESRIKFSSFVFVCYHTFHSDTLQTAVNLLHKKLQPNRTCNRTYQLWHATGKRICKCAALNVSRLAPSSGVCFTRTPMCRMCDLAGHPFSEAVACVQFTHVDDEAALRQSSLTHSRWQACGYSLAALRGEGWTRRPRCQNPAVSLALRRAPHGCRGCGRKVCPLL